MFFRRTPQPAAKPMREQLADITKSLDEVQALIYESRAMFPHDINIQIKLDDAQSEVNAARERQAVALKHIEESEKFQKYLQQ